MHHLTDFWFRNRASDCCCYVHRSI